MQSEQDVARESRRRRLRRRRERVTGTGAFLWISGVLPSIGFLSAFLLPLSLFGGSHLTLLVTFVVVANLLLHWGVLRWRRWLSVRAGVLGFVTGAVAFYVVLYLPLLPLIGIGFLFFVGVLLAAPYWAAIGLFPLWWELGGAWHKAGRSQLQFVAIIVLTGVAFPAIAVFPDYQRAGVVRDLITVARGHDADAREAARRLRGIAIDDPGVFLFDPRDDGLLGRFEWGSWAGSASNWIGRKLFGGTTIGADELRLANHRVSGTGLETDWRGFDRRSDRDAHFRLSALHIEVDLEADAALARVDQLLTLANDDPWSAREARLDFALPPEGVASALSLWIGEQERPAAFAGEGVASVAYARVVRSQRDPALLTETAPGRVRLLVFPVPARGTAQVRVAFTVPYRIDGSEARLELPRIVDGNLSIEPSLSCAIEVREAGEASSATRSFADCSGPIAVRRGASERVFASDARGFLIQTLVSRSPTPLGELVFAIDASTSVGADGVTAADIFDSFAPGTPCTVLIGNWSGHVRREGTTGAPELRALLDEVPMDGGADAAPILLEALSAARGRTATIVWLHGAQAIEDTPVGPLVAALREHAGPVVTGALDDGRNRVREALRDLPNVVTLPRTGALRADLARLAQRGVDLERARAGDAPIAGVDRRYLRVDEAPGDCPKVSDQCARLWAAQTARASLAGGDRAEARELAVAYRLVTAGTAAVVLESAEQYARFGLDPGAGVGREPTDLPIGSSVPEPATWILFGLGLLAFAPRFRRRRQAQAVVGR